MEVFREFEQAEAQEAAARREREGREAEYRWEMELNPKDLETSSEEGWVSDDSFN
jgi:hypothetical protein